MQILNITATGVYALGDAGTGTVTRQIVHVVINSGTLSATFEGRLVGSGLAAGEYKQRSYVNTNDASTIIAGATAITAEGIYDIDCTGVELFLNVGTVTSITVYVHPVLG